MSSREVNWPLIKHRWEHLKDLDLPLIDSSKVTVLLGRDVLRVHDVLDSRTPREGELAPDAVRTHFGWCITGPVPTVMLNSSAPPRASIFSINSSNLYDQLNDNIVHFWTTESLGVNPLPNKMISAEDKKALDILKSSIRHTGERYEVALMLKQERHPLPNNYALALRLFLSQERRFKKDPDYAAGYARVVNGYITAGHAKKVSPSEVANTPELWFLPHHGVVTPTKPGKIRVVFNPSARFKGISLNDQLYKGPDLLTSLIGIIMRFRRLPVPISGDIEKIRFSSSVIRFWFRESISLC